MKLAVRMSVNLDARTPEKLDVKKFVSRVVKLGVNNRRKLVRVVGVKQSVRLVLVKLRVKLLLVKMLVKQVFVNKLVNLIAKKDVK